jgi:histone H3/H4
VSKEIAFYEKYSNSLTIPLRPFRALCREILNYVDVPGALAMNFSLEAFAVLQTITEDSLVRLFKQSYGSLETGLT